MPISPFLMLRAAGRLCGLPLASVIETLRPLATSAVRGLPSGVVGVAVVRGQAVPVVDLSALLGATSEARGRWVVVARGEARIALACDEVLAVASLEGSTLASAPPLLAGSPGLQAIGARDGTLLAILDAGRLLPDEAWKSLARVAESPPAPEAR